MATNNNNCCKCTTPQYELILNEQGPRGRQGEQGNDGFSPRITVENDTNSLYTLKILTKDGQITTPNLKANLPLGGSPGQILTKNGYEDGEYAWENPDHNDLVTIDTDQDITANKNFQSEAGYTNPNVGISFTKGTGDSGQGYLGPLVDTNTGNISIGLELGASLGDKDANSKLIQISQNDIKIKTTSTEDETTTTTYDTIIHSGNIDDYIKAGENITITQDDTSKALTISSTGGIVEIPQATSTTLGGIKANAKTDADTQEVKIDTATGLLYTQASGGGTSDYTQLTNKPQINSHELTGNQTGNDLGLANEEEVEELGNELNQLAGTVTDVQKELVNKQDVLTASDAIDINTVSEVNGIVGFTTNQEAQTMNYTTDAYYFRATITDLGSLDPSNINNYVIIPYKFSDNAYIRIPVENTNTAHGTSMFFARRVNGQIIPLIYFPVEERNLTKLQVCYNNNINNPTMNAATTVGIITNNNQTINNSPEIDNSVAYLTMYFNNKYNQYGLSIFYQNLGPLTTRPKAKLARWNFDADNAKAAVEAVDCLVVSYGVSLGAARFPVDLSDFAEYPYKGDYATGAATPYDTPFPDVCDTTNNILDLTKVTVVNNIKVKYDNNTIKLNDNGQLYADISVPTADVTASGNNTFTGTNNFNNQTTFNNPIIISEGPGSNNQYQIYSGTNSGTNQLVIRPIHQRNSAIQIATTNKIYRGDFNNLYEIFDAGNMGRYVDGTTITYTGNKLSAVSSAPTNMVTTNTEQTISGVKTFSSDLKVNGGNNRIVLGNNSIISNVTNGLQLQAEEGNIIMNDTMQVMNDIVTANNLRIANGGTGNGVTFGDSNGLTTIYSNADIKAVINGRTETTITTALDLQAINDEIASTNDIVDSLSTAVGSFKFVKLTQSEYDDLATKDGNTMYIIVG